MSQTTDRTAETVVSAFLDTVAAHGPKVALRGKDGDAAILVCLK